MNADMRPLLISLRPRYADLVFEKLKKAELRRRFIMHTQNRDVYVYVTSPVMQLRGVFRAGQVWRDSPEEIWDMVSELAKLEKRDFDEYFKGRSIAYALEIKEVHEYSEPISLAKLRNQLPHFVVPQSWRYVRPIEQGVFRDLAPPSAAHLRNQVLRCANSG